MSAPPGRWARLARAAGEGLLRHRMRSALSALGLVVGVAAVVVMVAVGRGTENQVVGRVTSLGSNLLWVTPAKRPPGGARAATTEAYGRLRPGDAAALSRLDGVLLAVPLAERQVRAGGPAGASDTLAVGAPPEIFALEGHSLAEGRFYGEREAKTGKRLAVVGPSLRRNLAGQASLVGRSITLKGQPFLVVGELSPKGVDANGQDSDDRVYVPLKAAQQRIVGDRLKIGSIVLQAGGKEAMPDLPPEAGRLLRQLHRLRPGQPDDFQINSQLELAAAQAESSRVFSALISGVAGVSLLVAGVGIMAVMLIGVRERTAEIGLRRALGARRRDVRVQFLLEAGLLGLGGGLSGAALGLGLAWGLLLTGELSFALPWEAAAVGGGISLATAVIFGWLPAARAAAMAPAEALRQE